MKTNESKKIASLAFQGNWDDLLPLLRANPESVNAASGGKGYSPLHQAAWHGANPVIIGTLLSLEANRGQFTTSSRQTPQQIAQQKHPERADLQYLLAPQRRTLGQLLRKMVATESMFEPYDGNQTILDQLVSAFLAEPCPAGPRELEARIAAGLTAATGWSLESEEGEERLHDFGVEGYKLTADMSFWRERLLPVLTVLVPRAELIPLEPQWTTVSDLFDPAPETWGLRGDLFLWIEMRKALCHVEVPQSAEELFDVLSHAFACLTGTDLKDADEFAVRRFARGGMSSGFVSGEFWRRELIPCLQHRIEWLRESWSSLERGRSTS